jgi:hypothetical protein
MKLIALLIPLTLMLTLPAALPAGEMTHIGAVEDVAVMPFGTRVTARVDTGATTSSLDVTEYRIEGDHVDFTVASRCGNHKMRRPLLYVKTVRSAQGSNKRPVVMLDICVGSRVVSTKVTLNNRSRMVYPFLIGRSLLNEKYIVDVSRANILPPTCPGVKAGSAPAPGREES